MFNGIISGFYSSMKDRWSFNNLLLFLIFIYSFTPFINDKLNSIAELSLGLYFLYLLVKNPDNFRKDKCTLLFSVILIVQILSWLSVKISYPEFAYHVPKIDRLGKLFLFIPIAWGLCKFEDKFLRYIFILVLAGFFIGIMINSDFISQIKSGINGNRIDFGIRNAQHSSMVFGLIFILGILNVFLLENTDKKLILIIIPLIFISCAGLAFTQTRQSFVAIVAVILFLVPLVYFMKYQIKRKLVLFISVIFLLFIFLLNIEQFQNRFKDIKGIRESLRKIELAEKNFLNFEEKIDLYVKNIPASSSGVRIKSFLESLKWISQKPLLGWGSDGRSLVIDESKNFSDNFKKRFGHLHNYFLEILVSYGFFGLFCILLVYYFILASSFKIRDLIEDGRDYFLISLCFIIYWLTINNFESFNSFWTGVFVHNIFCGCIYSRYLKYKNECLIDL